jgi:hypothetical protein
LGAGDGGPKLVDGARRPLPILGVLGAVEAPCEGFGSEGRALFGGDTAPVLLRVLATGKAGRAMLGGPLEGLDGRGRVVDMAERVESGRSDEGSIQASVENSKRCASWQALKKVMRLN